MWVEEGAEPTPLLVAEDGTSIQLQFARQPWHEMTMEFGSGLTVGQVELILTHGGTKAGIPGRFYKCYDEATGQSFADPHLEESL